MNTLTNNILDTTINEVNSINENVKGLNFLEILKNNLIEKILPIINNMQFPLDQFEIIEKEINTDKRSVKITIKHIANSSIISKKLIEYDTLFIIFNEVSSFDIYKDEKNFVNILLYKNTGISLSKNTTINSKLKENGVLFEIQNKDKEQILTN